jgi:glycosyltransferase involved in cell wall biosynthesis
MKILVAVHSFNNYGGIINHTEHLIAGLKELGNSVDFLFLKPTQNRGIPDSSDIKCSIGEGTGLPVHLGKGWICEHNSYLNDDDIKSFIDSANNHDILIWESIFGFKNDKTERNKKCLKMISDVNSKQIVIIHDGNMEKLYPWIYKFREYFCGIACVHPCAYKSASSFDIPRAMILNPQKINPLPKAKKFEEKSGICSLQTFKRWKRADDLIAAVPYIRSDVTITGDGIEKCYMCSTEKCKDEYYCTEERDPNARKDLIGNRIWDNAEKHGMKYLGFVTDDEAENLINKSLFLVDPSWSRAYGEHFNRVVVDAMRHGTVPIAVNIGMSGRLDGVGTVFKSFDNYLMLNFNDTPQQYANKINEYLDTPKEEYLSIVKRNYKLIKQFDRKLIAQQYIDLANGKDTGFFQKLDTPKKNNLFKEKAEEMWWSHFENKPTLW